MEVLKDAKDRLTGKIGESFLGMVEKMLQDIDAFDQIAEIVKTVVPLKATVEVKGKKAVEVQAMLKNSVLWVGFKRIREEPRPEAPAQEEPKE